MGKKKKTKDKVAIEKSEIEKIAEEIAKEQPVEENAEDVKVGEIAEEIVKELQNEAPVEEAPAEEAPAEETPAEKTPAEKAPAEEETTEEAPAEEAPAEEATTEEAPAEEESAEKTPEEEVEEGKTGKKKGWKIAGIVVGIVVALFVATYFLVAMHYSDCFLMGTTVNGIDCEGQTVKEVRAILQKEVEEYALTLEEANDSTEVIKGTDIGIKYNGVNIIEEALEEQNHYLWIKALFSKKDIKVKIDFEYDAEKLDEVIGQLVCMKAENQVAPISAIPVYVDGTYEIQEEIYGTQINQEQLYAAIHNSVDTMDKTLNLEDSDCYVLPVFTKDSQEVVAAKDALNKCLEANITYSLDGINVTVDSVMIVNWISVDAANMTVNVNADLVRAFTDTLGSHYNTPNSSEQITSPTGKVAEISNARLGRVVGSAAECEQLINEIKEGKNITREPLFSQTATPEGTVAWGTTYIEVDITAQHMWYIANGVVAFECDIVTGSPGRDTPVGYYTILEKLRNKTLRGNIVPATGEPEYVTPVSYWARVTWSGIGFHDATWQAAFGGERYRQGYGSHGCINMALADVAAFYEMIYVGCPVLIHY